VAKTNLTSILKIKKSEVSLKSEVTLDLKREVSLSVNGKANIQLQ